jgi:hypothetical protein
VQALWVQWPSHLMHAANEASLMEASHAWPVNADPSSLQHLLIMQSKARFDEACNVVGDSILPILPESLSDVGCKIVPPQAALKRSKEPQSDCMAKHLIQFKHAFSPGPRRRSNPE